MQENKTELILETHHLSKTFKGQHAVNGISLHIPDCSIYGLLGAEWSRKIDHVKDADRDPKAVRRCHLL